MIPLLVHNLFRLPQNEVVSRLTKNGKQGNLKSVVKFASYAARSDHGQNAVVACHRLIKDSKYGDRHAPLASKFLKHMPRGRLLANID